VKAPYRELVNDLLKFIPRERVVTDEPARFALGTDASFYRLVPEVVVVVESEEEVAKVLTECGKRSLPVTFRAAGTSLSGQSISDSVLVVLGRNWKDYEILGEGEAIRLKPGVIGGHANRYLAPLGRKIGPDPASINAAMIGGIAANNASGMCCGTSQNSYRTLKSMRVLFADGTLLDTGDEDCVREFLEKKKDLVERVRELSARVKSNQELAGRIRRKFKMKNTTGYSLNALVDFEDPVEVIQHLMIGSEGTLGFISEITYNTVPEYPHKATSLLLFPDVETACRAVVILKGCPVEAAEIMDRASLRSVEGKEGMPDFLADLGEDVTAVLVDTKAPSEGELAGNVEKIRDALSGIETVMPVSFTFDPSEYERLWNIRKGLFPSVGAMREAGTTVIIEDVAFPLDRLAEATLELGALFEKHGYHDAIIFGHALDGNLHFVFSQDFNLKEEVERYAAFIDDVTRMVVEKYDGSLKAEHGTGRNMAPFVELEWGAEAYALMKEIKEIFDPSGLLNPGVIINHDREVHLKSLKPLPVAHEIVDKCIECGFCEVRCPSRYLTVTPRHRITLFREISRLEKSGNNREKLKNLKRAFRYSGDETCAADGLCSLSCPVGIDTGKLIKELRAVSRGPVSRLIASAASSRMDVATGISRGGLAMAASFQGLVGSERVERVSKTLRSVLGRRVPLLSEWVPGPASVTGLFPSMRGVEGVGDRVVYFPSCVTRTLGASKLEPDSRTVPEVVAGLLGRAGFELVLPPRYSFLCCGQAFESKGFRQSADRLLRELEEALFDASGGGKHPVLLDTSPCFLRLAEKGTKGLRLYEPVGFSLEFLLPRLEVRRKEKVVAIHRTCSTIKMGLGEKMVELAGLLSERVVIPEHVECCGFAGDKGFFVPELNESALFHLKEELPEECSCGYSTSRTCEIGLSRASGIPYRSIFFLVDECTK